ncbi:MAG: hypothetical protein ABIK07_16355, partial [Planctomycetota bacterium]
MSTGFAGSRSMDERRRRRLASESSESLDDSNEDSTSQTISRTNRFKAGQYPLRTIIFPKRWKLALYYLPVFLCFSGLIAADYYRSEFCTPDSALSGYLSLKQSPLPLYLTGCLLFVSGQISLLIASLRTQSLHDFSGRYRLWKWVAGGLFLFALCTTTQLHHVWATTVIELRLFDWGPHTTFFNTTLDYEQVQTMIFNTQKFGDPQDQPFFGDFANNKGYRLFLVRFLG